jgi:ADP-dependent phosphofructokinase/glucokinase
MLKLRDRRLFISSEFQKVIDEFNKRQEERMMSLLELIKEQTKKKKNRRKMKKHGQKNIIS